MSDFEKLGAFYLGKIFDRKSQETTDDLLLYDAKDLTTHALCVGMTGSGKTGLCVGILEEAAIDGIPAIVIDPKGDLGNLLLTFPSLQASDFRPWIDENEAMRKGLTPDAHAAKTAELWRNGLSKWGQSPERISRLKAAAEFSIYTPGSSAGLPLTILRSFAAPPAELLDDSDALRDRIMSAVSGLLGLLGIDADPIQSREHILLSNILDQSWRSGTDLEIADLIRAIMNPPFAKLGVFDLETFYPSSERSGLAMRLNNVLASPSFSSWMEGEPIDIENLLYTPEGKPRISILSISHLNEAERMFFVTVVLNEMVSWMRQQAGTSSLRALLYMDEIYGYFPPTANPPSKGPMLTLLKQARAYGIGCILATQNPVDLDYKGLGNTGTWFIGRLQTERDKLRVLDGLEGASAAAGKDLNRAEIDTILSGLGKRVFLMNNVHEDEPVLFNTRWVLSYLRGPFTRQNIEMLMRGRKRQQISQMVDTALPVRPIPGVAASIPSASRSVKSSEPPVLPASIKQVFLRSSEDVGGDNRFVYRPAVYAHTRLHFANARANVDEWQSMAFLASFPGDFADSMWEDATAYEDEGPELAKRATGGAEFSPLPSEASSARNYASWEKMLKSHLYQNVTMALWRCPELKLISFPDETEGEFRVRVTQAAHEARDLALEKLRNKYAARLATTQEKIRRTEMKVEREQSQYEKSRMSTVVSVGSTLLGAFMGRKAVSLSSMQRAASSMNRAGSAMREKTDIARAEQDLETAKTQLLALEERFQEESGRLKERFPADYDLSDLIIRPRKSDISVTKLVVAWTPWKVGTDGIADPLF